MRDKVICDLAETYGIFDYQQVPVPLLATLVDGLGPNSRVGMELDGRRESLLTVLVADLADMVEVLICGLAGKETQPERAATLLTEKAKPKKGFSIEEFENIRKRQVR